MTRPRRRRPGSGLRQVPWSLLRRRETRLVAWSGALAFCSSLFALMTARWLGADARGVVVVFMTTGSLMMLIGSAGVPTGARVALHEDPPLLMAVYVRYARRLSTLHVVTSASIGLFAIYLSGGLTSPWVAVTFVPYASLMLYSYFLREALYGHGLAERAVISDTVPTLAQLTLLFLLHYTVGTTTTQVLLIILLAASVQNVFLIFSVSRIPGPSARNPFGQNAWSLGRLISFSAPAMASTLGQAFIVRGDRLLLGALDGPTSVGLYSVGATFADLVWLGPSVIAQLVFHRTSVARKIGATRRLRRATMLAAVLSAVGLCAVAGTVIDVFLGNEFARSVGACYILALAAIPMASYQLDIALLNGLGRLTHGGAITGCGCAILLIMAFVLIPRIGLYGAAVASLGSYSALALLARLAVIVPSAGSARSEAP